MSQNLTITKGLDLKIAGGVCNAETPVAEVSPAEVAIVPDDFHGFLPKAEVHEGDAVACGEPLLYDKRDPQIKLVSPVSGTVKAIVRGERRKIERVVITPYGASQPETGEKTLAAADDVKLMLKNHGLWSLMRQRPYDIVPNPDATPRDIFVTAMDTAPLACDPAMFVAGKDKELAAAVKVLRLVTPGKIYISRSAGSRLPDIAGAEMVDVKGPHPAGNVGVQIANIAPVNKGETVWTLDITTLWRIGATVLTGKTPMDAWVGVTGSEINTPRIVKTVIGADIRSILNGDEKNDGCHHRIISGNLLTGVKTGEDGFLRYPYRQVTVIPEGDDVTEFMGWASLSPKKMSQSRTFPGRFFRRIFTPDARLLGGRRAFIMSGEYDRYLPMDILGEYLIKAILGRDIEQMEQLGIYEVAPEDFALGEYADTSKIEAQKIIREGLDYLRKELE